MKGEIAQLKMMLEKEKGDGLEKVDKKSKKIKKDKKKKKHKKSRHSDTD